MERRAVMSMRDLEKLEKLGKEKIRGNLNMKENFETMMNTANCRMEYKKDADGDYTDEFTALMYFSFTRGMEFLKLLIEEGE